MKGKIAKIVSAGALLIGTLGLAACSSSSPGYGYNRGYNRGYAPAYAPAYAAPSYGYAPAYQPGYSTAPGYAYAGEGDYDEHRAWHNRDWWVNNRPDWVKTNHNGWLTQNQVNARAAAWDHRQDAKAAALDHRQEARAADRVHDQERAQQQAQAARHAQKRADRLNKDHD